MSYRQIVTALAILAMLILGGYWLFRPRPILIETAAVSQQHFVTTVLEDGRTRIRDRYVISAPLSGLLLRPSIRAGDPVVSSQQLATIMPNLSPLLDPRERRELEERVGAAEAAVDEARALQERARVLLSQAQTDLGRTRQLRERGYAAVSQLDRETYAVQSAERALGAADRRRHAAEHTLVEAQAALKRMDEPGAAEGFKLLSPITGRVLRVMKESEAAVSAGTPLFELGDPSDLEIAVDLLTADAARVEPGAVVSIERWGGPKALAGRVRRVEPSGFTKVSPLGVEEQRVWVIIDITAPHEQWLALGDAFRVDARITLEEIEDATVAPEGALFRRGDNWYVFVAEGGRARLRQVEVGARSGRLAAITKGLQPGETVIAYPPSSLSDNSRVRVE